MKCENCGSRKIEPIFKNGFLTKYKCKNCFYSIKYSMKKELTHSEVARKGGIAVRRKYGIKHFSKFGKRLKNLKQKPALGGFLRQLFIISVDYPIMIDLAKPKIAMEKLRESVLNILKIYRKGLSKGFEIDKDFADAIIVHFIDNGWTSSKTDLAEKED